MGEARHAGNRHLQPAPQVLHLLLLLLLLLPTLPAFIPFQPLPVSASAAPQTPSLTEAYPVFASSDPAPPNASAASFAALYGAPTYTGPCLDGLPATAAEQGALWSLAQGWAGAGKYPNFVTLSVTFSQTLQPTEVGGMGEGEFVARIACRQDGFCAQGNSPALGRMFSHRLSFSARRGCV